MEQSFTVNGITYARLEDIPEPERSRVANIMKGLPALDGLMDDIADDIVIKTEHTAHKVIYDGELTDVTALPTDIRHRVQSFLDDEDGDGIPDIFQTKGHVVERVDHRPLADWAVPPVSHGPADDDRSSLPYSTVVAMVGLAIIVALVIGYLIGSA